MKATETKTLYSISAETLFKINEFLLANKDGITLFNILKKDLLKHNVDLSKKDKEKKRDIIKINRKAKKLFRYLAENRRNIKLSLDMKEIKANHFKLIIQEKTIVVYYHYNETPEEMETLYIVIVSDNDEFYKQVVLTFNSGTEQEYKRTLLELLVEIEHLRY